MEDTPFVGEPEDSRETIMRATYVAMEEHGYAGLSIQRIADEADLSKSTFYHHFDDKGDLLQSFIEFTLEELTAILVTEAGDDPEDNLRTLLELVSSPDPDLSRPMPDDVESMLGTYVELRAQAVRDEAIRETFERTDRALENRIERLIRDGITAGDFREVDPEATANFLLTLTGGHLFRRTTRVRDPSPQFEASLDEYLDAHLLR